MHAGEEVDCQNAVTKLWDKTCKIVKKTMDSGHRYWVKFANDNKLRLRGRSLLRRIVKRNVHEPATLHNLENTDKPDQGRQPTGIRERLRGAARRLCPGSVSQCDSPVPDRRCTGGGTSNHSPYNLRGRNSTKKVKFTQ